MKVVWRSLVKSLKNKKEDRSEKFVEKTDLSSRSRLDSKIKRVKVSTTQTVKQKCFAKYKAFRFKRQQKKTLQPNC